MIERRNHTAQREAGKIKLTIPFNSWSERLGFLDFRERILPGAFDASLAGNENIVALWSHDQSKPLARRDNGSLALSATDAGLVAEITPDTTSWSQDAR